MQRVAVKSFRTSRETFTLSGWAKGCGLPNHEREGLEDATFRLRAAIWYEDSRFEEYTADFSPNTEEWQFASIQFSKERYHEINCILVLCEYDYNTGVAYFDDIQLTRDKLETGLYADAFTTQAEDDGAEVSEDEMDATDDETPTFEEALDAYGNALTETTFTDGEFGTIYRSFGYSENGNDLAQTIDARDNTTAYTVDEDTSRNEEVTDRCGNKYEYDTVGRTTKVTNFAAKRDENGELVKDETDKVLYDELANVFSLREAFERFKVCNQRTETSFFQLVQPGFGRVWSEKTAKLP